MPINFTGSYSENFDTLASTGTSNPWANDTTLSGWSLFRQPAPGTEITAYAAGTGSSNAGSFYSFGTSTEDRALGGLGSGGTYYGSPATGAVAGWIAFSTTNTTGATINDLTVNFDGEQWRNGGNTTAQTMVFEYGFGSSFTAVSTWNTPGTTFNWTSPVATSTAAEVDGNSIGQVADVGGVLSNLNWANNDTLWFRWVERNDAGNDHGLAIDDFSISTGSTPPPPGPLVTITASPDSTTEGNLTAALFTITRTGDTTSPLTVNFTTGGTATSGTDYLTPDSFATSSIIIPAGQSSVSIAISTIDDNDVEPVETVTVTLNPSANYTVGASAAATVNISDDDVPLTLISQIQGSGATSAFINQTKTIEAIVVGDFQRVGSVFNLRGFYLQEEDADADGDPLTSEGLFIFDDVFGTDVNVGDKVQVTGVVAEFTSGNSSLTQLRSVTDVSIQSTGNAMPTAAEITFPVVNTTGLEAFEGMRVTIPDTLTVTEHFQLGRFGQVVLSSGGASNQSGTDNRLDQYTQFNSPSVSGYSAYLEEIARRRIVLDDGLTIQNPDPIVNARGGNPLSASNTLRGGDTVTGLSGILDDRFGDATVGQYRIQPVAPVDFQPTNPRPTATPDVGGRLQVASFNVLNYFNGDGLGGGFPTSRGADTAEEFTRQRNKTISAILGLNADVVGLIEIENDGFGANSALQDLVNGLNSVAGAGTYAFINAGVPQIGTDEITVAFIYKPASVTPVGNAAILDKTVDPRFDSDNQRPALAQTFEENATGALFTPVINHLKSKGSSAGNPGDEDAGDGQGLSNGTRTRAAESLVDWLATNPTGVADADYLVMGDLNAYAKEDPLIAIQSGADNTAGTADDFTNLLPISTYSFVFSGQWGSLDHALASSSLTSQVTGAAKWHINADEPNVLDYNTEFKSAGQITSLYAPDAFRSSDHDPVLVGLNLAVPREPVDLRFGQRLARLTMQAFQDGVLIGEAQGRQNGVAPSVAPFTLFAINSADSGRGANFVDRTWLDQGEGIGIADGDDGNSAARKRIDGDELLGIAVAGFEAKDGLINIDRVASTDGAQIRVEAFRNGAIVDSEVFALGSVPPLGIQTLTFGSESFFDTLRISAADADTRFTFRTVELQNALAV